MDCDARYRISCELRRIADALDANELESCFATLLAPLIGAGAAGLIRWVLDRHELHTRRQSQIDTAVSDLIREVQRYSQEYQAFISALQTWQASEANRLHELTAAGISLTTHVATPMPAHPPREGIDTAVEMLVVLTAGDDRRVAERVRQVLYELNFLEDFAKQRIEYASVRRVLVAWRARKRDADATIASLDTIDQRRRIHESRSDEPLPDSPEPMTRDSVTGGA